MRAWASDAALVAISALLVVGFTASYTGPPPYSLNVVVGHSMQPTLKPGDLVLGVATWATGFGPGDVVVCNHPSRGLLVHRVVSIEGGLVTVKGDLSLAPDPPAPASSVRYRVVASAPLRSGSP